MPPDPARSAARAADRLQSWLDGYGVGWTPSAGASLADRREPERSPVGLEKAGHKPDSTPVLPQDVTAGRIAPAHTDWLYHHLTVTGPVDELAAFRKAAGGAGVIPWRLDLDRMEEDFFLYLAAPPAGQARTRSLEGARMLAAELREAVGRRHALAVARVGRSRACPFDLHALLPVPDAVLRLGPDHPDAIDCLWTNWGTTDALRHLASGHWPLATDPCFRVSFWAADWTPWPALEKVRADWPGLRFAVRPVYEPT